MATPSLKSLAENKTCDGLTKTTGFRVDPRLVVLEPGFNLRTEGPELDAHIERFYLAMKAGAFVPPIDVSVSADGVITAREGHCRVRAALRLQQEVPEFTLEARQLRGNEKDFVLHMLGTGSGGKPLSPLEQGEGYKRLRSYGMTAGDIAARLGVSRQTIDNGLALADAPVEVQQMIAQEEVSATTAREAIRNGTDGVEALKEAVAERRAEEQAEQEPVAPAPAPVAKKKGRPKTKAPAPAKKKKVTAKALRGTAAGKHKVQGYKFAVQWIANNDNPKGKKSVEDLAASLIVALVADIYGKEQAEVALQIWEIRNPK